MPWTELVKVGTDSARLLHANTVVNATQGVAAIPSGHALDVFGGWVQQRKPLPVRFYAASESTFHGREYGSTDFTIGVTWLYGGRLNGTGRFIRDADAFVSVSAVPLGHSWTIDVRWSDPRQLDDGVAQLHCDFTLHHERLDIPWFSWNYRIFIQGDGAAWSQNLA